MVALSPFSNISPFFFLMFFFSLDRYVETDNKWHGFGSLYGTVHTKMRGCTFFIAWPCNAAQKTLPCGSFCLVVGYFGDLNDSSKDSDLLRFRKVDVLGQTQTKRYLGKPAFEAGEIRVHSWWGLEINFS